MKIVVGWVISQNVGAPCSLILVLLKTLQQYGVQVFHSQISNQNNKRFQI